MEKFDILIIGAGAAGIAAAKSAAAAGCESILLVDRGPRMGGILLQCAHRGFGSALTGPEYTRELLSDFPRCVTFCPNTTVLDITAERTALLSSETEGRRWVAFRQMILATGCREIPMGALPIAGTRPKGIYTAGHMQALMNLHDHIPEGPAVILGSGDLGLIMGAQLRRADVEVAAIVEKKTACGGLKRNRNCLEEFQIPLICGTTIQEVFGAERLEGVSLENGTYIPCRTLLIAVGLLPDQILVHGLQNVDWLHLCGNCHMVHPMVEAVIQEGKQAGVTAYEMIRGSL